MPTAKAVLRHTWEKGKEYLKKMGTIILGASIIVWALSYFPTNEDRRVQAENSYMAKIGKTIAAGWCWCQGGGGIDNGCGLCHEQRRGRDAGRGL